MSGEASGTRPPTARQLTIDECRALIEGNYLAVVATVGAGQPYATPLIYGFDDDCFYFVTADGRKTRNMEEQPRVCITVIETEDHARKWRSILAFGTVEWLTDESEVDHALAIMRRQYPATSTRRSAGAASLTRSGFRMARVRVDELTGRAQGVNE